MSTSSTVTEKQEIENTVMLSTANMEQVNCQKCDKKLKPRDKCIRCSTCKLSFHIKCQGLTEQNYEFLKEGDNILWFCNSCKETTRGMVENLSNVEKRVTTLEGKVESKADREEVQQLDKRLTNFMLGAKTKLETKADITAMDDLDQRVTSIEQKVNNDKETDELSKLLEEKLKEQREAIESQRANKTESSLSDAVKEMEDRKRRSCNIVIHNIIESNATDANARKSHDQQLVKQVFKDHLNVQSHINQLEGVQHRATKMLSSISHLAYTDRLKELNLPSLSFRRMRGDAIEMYKYCHNKYNVDNKPFTLVSDINNQSVTRNHGFKVRKEKTNNSVRSRFFGNRVANTWNALPASIVNAPSLNAFKNRLDEHWKSFRFIEDMRTIPFHRTVSNASINFW